MLSLKLKAVKGSSEFTSYRLCLRTDRSRKGDRYDMLATKRSASVALTVESGKSIAGDKASALALNPWPIPSEVPKLG